MLSSLIQSFSRIHLLSQRNQKKKKKVKDAEKFLSLGLLLLMETETSVSCHPFTIPSVIT